MFSRISLVALFVVSAFAVNEAKAVDWTALRPLVIETQGYISQNFDAIDEISDAEGVTRADLLSRNSRAKSELSDVVESVFRNRRNVDARVRFHATRLRNVAFSMRAVAVDLWYDSHQDRGAATDIFFLSQTIMLRANDMIALVD